MSSIFIWEDHIKVEVKRKIQNGIDHKHEQCFTYLELKVDSSNGSKDNS